MRVLCLPGRHPYVAHLQAPTGGSVVRVDGDLDHAAAGGQGWAALGAEGRPAPDRPALGLVPDLTGVDLVHVHVGLTACPEHTLRALLAEVARRGVPLVVTVHDLPHPAHPDPDPLARALELLIPAADELVTVTVAAARLVLAGWGRTSHVLPHPHVLDLDRLGAPHRPVGPPVVGLPAATVTEGLGALVDAALEVVEQVPGARLRVDLPQQVAARDDALVDRLAARALGGLLDLRRGGQPAGTDPAVYLRQVDVCVLHRQDASLATWIEACSDAGLPVVAPEHALYADRSAALTYEPGLPSTLAVALRAALRGHPTRQASREDRLAERALVALAHTELYGALLDGPSRRAAGPDDLPESGTGLDDVG